MTEILTESFCERCGTRYTFESSAPRQRRLSGLKVLGRGLKNFVMSDDASLDEAIAGARSDADREATGHQLDAFHKTFSFCMSCRQYTCANCWNEVEARCLSCSPFEVAEAVLVPEADIDPERLLRSIGEFPVEAPALDAVDATLREPEAAVAESPAVDGMEPGQSLDDAIAAFEAGLAVEPPEAVAETPLPIEAADIGATPETAPERIAAVAEPEVEPEPQLELEPEVELEPETPAPTGVDVVEQPAWPATPAKGPEPITPPPPRPAAPTPPAGPPQWPSGPRWPTGISAGHVQPPPQVPPPPLQAGDPLAALMARETTDAMWAASNREILRPVAAVQPTPAIQSCGTCGISLSANARFCRRCGTAQGT
jgi:hypothetical protein